nr:DUF4910 domain-containing protein [Aeromonas salmonicida]
MSFSPKSDYLPTDWDDQGQLGEQLHRLLTLLFPLNRSLTGDGVRQTLALIRQHCLPDLQIREVASRRVTAGCSASNLALANGRSISLTSRSRIRAAASSTSCSSGGRAKKGGRISLSSPAIISSTLESASQSC